eukprot:1595811-Alexandrium_andersonii.AAC.1
MSASLVGSEMCIRDSFPEDFPLRLTPGAARANRDVAVAPTNTSDSGLKEPLAGPESAMEHA